MSTTQLVTPEIELERIHVVDGFNARRHFDPRELERMAETIKEHGIVQPLLVRPREDGDFDLVAGERRYRAAQIAEVKTAPITIGTGNPHVESFIENAHRAALDPIEEAEGLAALAADRGLTTNKAIAAEIGMSRQWVAGRRRLLKLPPRAQETIAAGTVPIDAEPELRKIAAASPRIAECVCEVFARGDTETGDFCRDLDELLYAVADAVVDGTLADPPTMIDPRHVRFGEVIDDDAEREELAARLRAATGIKAMAADLVKVTVERHEREAKKREKEARRREKEDQKAREDGQAADPSTQGDEERDRREAQRAAAVKEEAERRKAARSYNERVGHALIKRRGAQNRKRFGLARAKAGAIALVLHDRTLAAAGLRLVMPQMQGLQTEAGDDGPGGKVAYAGINQAGEFLVGRIEDAKSVAEVCELISDAQIAAILADEDALEPGEGAWRHDPAEERVKEILAAEIKELAPRRSPKQRKPMEEAA
jgi:ParB/RepB/Spo0J family partition protein